MRSRSMLPIFGALVFAVACDDSTHLGDAFAPNAHSTGAVVLEQSQYAGQPGDTARIRAFVLDVKGRRFTVEDLDWNSADSSIAVVNEGRLYLVQPGETQLSVDYKGTKLQASARASNNVKITGIDVFPEALSLTVDEAKQLGLFMRYSDGRSIENSLGVNWSSADPSVATVSRTGMVTALKTGQARIIGKRGNRADTATVTVVASEDKKPAPTLTVAPDTGMVEVGQSFRFSTALSTGEKSPEGVTWTISDPTVAAISPSGQLTGKKEGLATVQAVYAGKGVKAVLRVVPAPEVPEEEENDGGSDSDIGNDPTDRAPSTTTPPPASAVRMPELPREFLDTRYVRPTGRTLNVSNSQALHQALKDARDGDEIVLTAGTEYRGNFTLPRRSSNGGWVTIRTSALGQLPAEGVRVSPSVARHMPRIVSENNEPAIRTAPGASGFRFVGIEVTYSSTVRDAYTLVAIGTSGSAQDTMDEVPSRVVFDRVYVHGHPNVSFQRCIALNAARAAVVDSYLSECHGKGFDSQAILGWNGPGPFKIVNNYLEGAGENIMFGGADPSVPNLTPSDIEIRRNHIRKPMSWKGVWSAKNLFELKHAQRVLFEGNILENSWVHGQVGYAILFQALSDNNSAPWTKVRDITVRYNHIRNAAGGINIASRVAYGSRALLPTDPSQRILIEHNVLSNIGNSELGSNGRGIALSGDLQDVTLRSNTISATLHALSLSGAPQSGLVVERNIFTATTYGVFGDSKGEGKVALDVYAPGAVFRHNVLPIASSKVKLYPADNIHPARNTDIGFVNLASWDLRLGSGSSYAAYGADWSGLLSATSGVEQR